MSKNRHSRNHIIFEREKHIKRRRNCTSKTKNYFSYLDDPSLTEWEKKNEDASWIIHWRYSKDRKKYELLKNSKNIEVIDLSSLGSDVYCYRSVYPRYRKRKFLLGYLSKNRSYLLKHIESGKTSIDGYGPKDVRRILSMEEQLCEFHNEHVSSNSLLRKIKKDKNYKYHD